MAQQNVSRETIIYRVWKRVSSEPWQFDTMQETATKACFRAAKLLTTTNMRKIQIEEVKIAND